MSYMVAIYLLFLFQDLHSHHPLKYLRYGFKSMGMGAIRGHMHHTDNETMFIVT